MSEEEEIPNTYEGNSDATDYTPIESEYFPPTILSQNYENQIQYFCKFFDDDVVLLFMTNESNRYANHIEEVQKEFLELHPHSSTNEFSEIAKNEMLS